MERPKYCLLLILRRGITDQPDGCGVDLNLRTTLTMDFDGERVTFSNQGLAGGGPGASPAEEGVSGGFGDGVLPSRAEAQRQLREFIRNFRMGSLFPYR